MIRTALFCLSGVFAVAIASAADDATVKPKDDGYRGIWFTLGQYTDGPYGKGDWKSFWDYGDKYSGGLGTYTADHTPIAVYAPAVKKTFFCYVRKVIGAEPGTPFAVLWADGNPDKLSISRLYFADFEGKTVRRLPYDMKEEFATPEILEPF